MPHDPGDYGAVREIIERIQRLDEDAQHYLMKVIEQVRVAIGHP